MKTTVRELMSTDLYTLGKDDDFVSADQVMRLRRVRHVPVVEHGVAVGLVTHRDLIRAQAKLFARAAAKDAPDDEDRVITVRISEIMSRELATCAPDTPADDAARRMLDDKIGCVLVVEDGKLVGLVSESDVVKWAVELMAKQRFEE